MSLLDDYFEGDDLCTQLRCSKKTLARYEQQPDGLPFIKIAGRKIYEKGTTRDWLMRRMTRPNPRRGS